jgi:hypothetical protein
VSFANSDRILKTLSTYLNEGAIEIRTTAKKGFLIMRRNVPSESEFDRLLLGNLNEESYKKVKNFVEKEGSDPFVVTNSSSTVQSASKRSHSMDPFAKKTIETEKRTFTNEVKIREEPKASTKGVES